LKNRNTQKVNAVENSQRDINIAFMNELAMIFDRMGIDTKEVIEAMNTKWNALKFYPGLVGGHCIGVDPYYFLYQAEQLGYHSQIVLSGRKINDGMGEFVADAIIRKLVLANKVVKQARVVILGITFKENCPDIRNSKVEGIISRLKEYDINPIVVDPWADVEEAKREYDIDLVGIQTIEDVDCIVVAVAHKEFKELSLEKLNKMYIIAENCEKILVDVKSVFDKNEIMAKGYSYWRL